MREWQRWSKLPNLRIWTILTDGRNCPNWAILRAHELPLARRLWQHLASISRTSFLSRVEICDVVLPARRPRRLNNVANAAGDFCTNTKKLCWRRSISASALSMSVVVRHSDRRSQEVWDTELYTTTENVLLLLVEYPIIHEVGSFTLPHKSCTPVVHRPLSSNRLNRKWRHVLYVKRQIVANLPLKEGHSGRSVLSPSAVGVRPVLFGPVFAYELVYFTSRCSGRRRRWRLGIRTEPTRHRRGRLPGDCGFRRRDRGRCGISAESSGPRRCWYLATRPTGGP